MQVEVSVGVGRAMGLEQDLHTRATVTLPDESSVGAPPVVCFAFPGAGYSRRYFTFDMPGSDLGGQAGWHVSRGWIFVSCDHVYTGDSDGPASPEILTLEDVVAANAATVDHITRLLAEGGLARGVPPVVDPVRIGIGQSMGGGLTILQQGQLGTFDAIGVLGYSAHHTELALPPGIPKPPPRYVLRGASVQPWEVPPLPEWDDGDETFASIAWGFHHDDVPREIVAADLGGYPTRRGQLPQWGSATIPPCAVQLGTPGVVAPEAAVIAVPIFIGVGERDVCPDPMREPGYYERSSDVTVFVCPRMAHMHNFASTREVFWARLHGWGAAIQRMER